MKKAILYIVACIDTEGPANYALDSWDKVDEVMHFIATEDFRAKYRDYSGNNLKLSYFIMDWTGFTENPVGRDMGYGSIYEHYNKLFASLPPDDYCIGWHYHHPPAGGKWLNGGWNRRWDENNEYENQINHMILDRGLFPVIYRAGGTIENNEQSRWLEEWIPFDFSSRAPEPTIGYYMRNFKSFIRKGFKVPLWDWSTAPSDWRTYHPSKDDYRLEGGMKRIIFRCLDICSGGYKIGKKDIISAFRKARDNGIAFFSFFTHDFYKSVPEDIMTVLSMIKDISGSFPDIEYRYETALGAARKAVPGIQDDSRKTALEIKIRPIKDRISIELNRDIYSKQPWVAVKDLSGKYRRIEASRAENFLWSADMDTASVKTIGVAASDSCGEYIVKRLNL